MSKSKPSLRDELRSIALKSPPRKRVPVEYAGAEFELLSPTILERKMILEKAKKDGESASMFEIAEWAAIYCTVIPGTTEKIFEETDIATFGNMGVNGFLDRVIEAIPELLNTAEDPKLESVD